MRQPSRFGALWHHADFLKLWTGETVSLFGSQVTTLALPLVAILTLNATPFQVALLSAIIWTPYLCIPLLAGVWIDQHRRRPIMISADLGRMVLLGLIPLTTILHIISIELVYLIAFFVGILTVFFNLSYRSYLPSLVGREHILEGNSKLQVSDSVSQIGGQGLGGLLVQIFTAPLALLIDALSFLVSAIGLLLIRKPEAAPAPPASSETKWQQIIAGLRLTFKNPFLRSFALAAMTYNLFDQVIMALFVVYATRQLLLPPALLGTILAMGSIGALIGSLFASPLSRKLGLGPALIWTNVLECAAFLLIPLAGGPFLLKVTLLTAAFFLNGMGLSCANVYYPSLRQTLIPDTFQGRVAASYSWLTLGVVPLGAVLAGTLQRGIGIHATLWFGAVGVLLSLPWIMGRHLRTLRELPQEEISVGEQKQLTTVGNTTNEQATV